MNRALPRSALPFWLLAASAFLIPVLPRLVSHGLFMDGLWYAVIARNLALGVGSFWRPMFTPSITPTFFADHPPLSFGIESLFFRALGDHWWVASVYSSATALVTMALLLSLWRRCERLLGAAPDVPALGWLPLLLWVVTPLVTWSYSNNMLENTMGIFVLLAALAFLRAARSPRRAAWSVAAGIALFAALLCKGLVGLFPLAFPLILALALRRPSPGGALALTLLALATVAALVALTLQLPAARLYAERYLEGNLIPLVSGSRGGVANRLHIVGKLLLELAPALAIVVLLAWFGRSRGGGMGVARARVATALLLLGLAGSLPLVLSPIQSGFYLVPSFALFAVGLAVFARPSAEALLRWMKVRLSLVRALTAFSALLLAGSLGYAATRIGTIGRGGSTIADVRAIGTVVPPGATVSVCPELAREWALHGYFALYDRITLDAGPLTYVYFVAREDRCKPPAGMSRVALPTRSFHLYRRP